MFTSKFEAICYLLKLSNSILEDNFKELSDEDQIKFAKNLSLLESYLLNTEIDVDKIKNLAISLKTINNENINNDINIFLKYLDLGIIDNAPELVTHEVINPEIDKAIATRFLSSPSENAKIYVNSVSHMIVTFLEEKRKEKDGKEYFRDFLNQVFLEEKVLKGKSNFYKMMRNQCEKEAIKKADILLAKREITEDSYESKIVVFDKKNLELLYSLTNVQDFVLDELKNGSIETQIWLQYIFSLVYLKDSLGTIFKTYNESNALKLRSTLQDFRNVEEDNKAILQANYTKFKSNYYSKDSRIYRILLELTRNPKGELKLDNSDEFLNNYLMSVMSYIISGSYNSMHEILGGSMYHVSLFRAVDSSILEFDDSSLKPLFDFFYHNGLEKCDDKEKQDIKKLLNFSSFLTKYKFNVDLNFQALKDITVSSLIIHKSEPKDAFRKSINEAKNIDETFKIISSLCKESYKKFDLACFINGLKDRPLLVKYFDKYVMNGQHNLNINLDYHDDKNLEELLYIHTRLKDLIPEESLKKKGIRSR